MKTLFSVITLSVAFTAAVMAQSYQPQYPYDPYNPSPQPQPQTNYGATYGGAAPTYGSPAYGSMLGYQSLDVNYVYNDFKDDNKLEGASGFSAALKLELMKPLYLNLGLERITSSTPKAEDIDITKFSAAGGVFLPLGNRFHIFGELGAQYDYVSGDENPITSSDFSVFIRPGIRFAATDKLELSASLLFTNTDNLDERVLELNAYYAMLSWLDVGVGVDFGDDINSYHLGGRWRW
jgi:hypothetical protein